MEGISITMAEVSATSSSIRNTNASLSSTLQQIKGSMNNLSSTWQSQAGETIRARFNALAPKFDNYKEIVDSYSKFLDNTVTNYNATEGAINNIAGQFK